MELEKAITTENIKERKIVDVDWFILLARSRTKVSLGEKWK